MRSASRVNSMNWCLLMRRGSVDDDAFDIGRNTHRERARDFRRNVEWRNPVNTRLIVGAFCEPASARCLRSRSCSAGELAVGGVVGGKIRRNRGLAGPAFRVQHHDFECHESPSL